jgi:ABC-type antimicrobial peptide transport system permease subunit
LINETLARTQFPNGDAVGRRITINQEFQSEVIGVVGDVAAMSPSDPPALAIYVPFYRMPLNAWFMSVLVRTGGDSVGRAQDYESRTLERTIHELAPGFAVQVVSMRGIADERSAAEGFRAIVMGAVTLIATMLASLGVYGITAHYVKQRRREIAIQMALGATPSRMILAIELRAIWLAVAGILLASIATYPALKFLRGLLFGTADLGVSTVAWAAAVVSILVMLAAYLPGREIIKLTLRDLLTDN